MPDPGERSPGSGAVVIAWLSLAINAIPFLASSHVPSDLLHVIKVPTHVVVGGASGAGMIEIGQQIASVLPNGQCQILEGQEHVVPPEILAPVLAAFLTG